MSALIAFVLLFSTALTAWRPGRAHHPIALHFCWGTVAAFAVTQPIPALMIYVATATPPAAVVAAAWASGQSRVRPYFGILFFAGAAIATLIAVLADQRGIFGQCMAYFWVSCAVAGGAALYRSDAPAPTRVVLALLIGALPCEAVGWLSWGAGFDSGYAFSRMITNMTFLVIIGIQVGEGAAWWPRWATLRGLHLERVRGWARFGRRAELSDNESNEGGTRERAERSESGT